jgi:hypothetical protein
MSNEINGVLKVLHETRRLQSRIVLLTTQLSRHERTRNAAAFEPSVPSSRALVSKPPASLSLANVLNDADSLLLEQWGDSQLQQSTSVAHHRPVSAESALNTHPIAMEEHRDQMVHLRNVVERLRTTYNIRPNAVSSKNDQSDILLSQVDGSELVSLLGLIYSVARLAEDNLAARISMYQSQVNNLLKVHKISDASSSSSQVCDEIAHVNSLPVDDARVLSVPYQSFHSAGSTSLVQHMIVTKSWLSVVDLSHCLLGDRCVGNDLLQPLSKLQHLVVLMLADNALTDMLVPMLRDVLPGMMDAADYDEDGGTSISGRERDNALHVLRFPKLRVLNLEDNLIARALLDDVYLGVERYATKRISSLHSFSRLVDEPSKRCSVSGDATAEEILPRHLRHLHCEATSMHAAILARSLLCCHLDHGTGEPYHIFSGASFASVVAVALMLDTPFAKLWSFFTNVSTKVFIEYHYSFYAVSATRSLRKWWTGGDYYSSDAFRNELIGLFGDAAAHSTLQQLHATTGKHCLLVASIAGQTGAAPVAFRSWATTKPTAQLQDATGALNESMHVRLVDALLACCASSHMFAPVTPAVVPENGTAPVPSRTAKACCDSVVGSMDLIVAELLISLRGRTALESTLFSPTEPFAAQDLLDPSMHKKVSDKLREQAETRATSTYNSAAAWQEAQGALVLWGDVNLSVTMSTLRRLMAPDHSSLEREASWNGPIEPRRRQSPFSLKTVFTVKKHASVRKSAVRLDEPHLERTVEVLEDSFRVPIL